MAPASVLLLLCALSSAAVAPAPADLGVPARATDREINALLETMRRNPDDAEARENLRRLLASFMERSDMAAPASSGVAPDEEVDRMLARLRRDPKDVEARARLDQLLKASIERYESVASPEAKLPSPEAREEMLRDAYQRLARPHEWDLAVDTFMSGADEFWLGRYLSAWDRLSRVAVLDQGPDWVKAETRRLLNDKLPKAFAAKLAQRPPELQAAYGAGWEALRRQDWAATLTAWKGYLAACQKRRDTHEEGEVHEIKQLVPWLELRIAAPDLFPSGSAVSERLAAVERAPQESIQFMDTLLFQSQKLRAGEARRVRDGLVRAYTKIHVDAAIAKMRRTYEKKQTRQTLELISSILAKDPGNQEVSEFLVKMQGPAAPPKPAKVLVAAKTEGAAAPAAAAAPLPPPPKTPSLLELAQAEAYYKRGLGAYATGDLDQAAKEWQTAMELDPSHPKVKRALERVKSEIVATRKRA